MDFFRKRVWILLCFCYLTKTDLIFLQGIEVVLKVALALLGNHKELIKQCIGFESVVEFLKSTLPEMGIIQMERVINEVSSCYTCADTKLLCNKKIQKNRRR